MATVKPMLLAFTIVLHVVSVLLFLRAFFPPPPVVSDPTNAASTNGTSTAGGRVVLVVVDALRADFPLRDGGVHMSYVRSLLDGRQAVMYAAQTQLPTVTLPRIKAITTGGVSSFVDVLTNFFAGKSQSDDNLLAILRSSGRQLVFHGDETWLKLYPDAFLPRSDGTTSFFVADWTEVDDNVTRHLHDELHVHRDWQLLLLHYLGLDHIGHFLGPGSAQLDVKLEEMDDVIRQIQLNCTDCTLVVLGDHGMTEAGSHGGASPPERAVPLIFIAPSKHSHRRFAATHLAGVQQIDVVPTLAALFGVAAPVQSLGVPLYPVLTTLLADSHETSSTDCDEQVMNVCRQNREHLLRLCGGQCSLEDEDAAADDACSAAGLARMYSGSKAVQARLLGTSADYNEPMLRASLLMAVVVCLCCVCQLQSLIAEWSVGLFVVGTAAAALSSSLVEEEHYIFYFAVNSWLWLQLLRAAAEFGQSEIRRRAGTSVTDTTIASRSHPHVIKLLLALVVHRLARQFISTGVKWQHLPSLFTWLRLLVHLKLMSLWNPVARSWLLLASDVYALASTVSGGSCTPCSLAAPLLVCLLIGYQHTDGQLLLSDERHSQTDASTTVWLARCVLVGALLLLLLWPAVRPSQPLLTVALLLSRPEHAALMVCIDVLAKLLNSLHTDSNDSHQLRPLLWYICCYACFYYTGNSNSFGSIDVSRGYVAVHSYRPAVVAGCVLLQGYVGPLLFMANQTKPPASLLASACLLRCVTLSVHLGALYLHRHHLFVWSVFAPKLFYEISHSLFVIGCIAIYCMLSLWRSKLGVMCSFLFLELV